MWPCSRNSEGGSATEALPMLASPGVGVTVAVKVGNLPRLVPPFIFSFSFGLKGRPMQSDTWKGGKADASMSSFGSEKRAPAPCRIDSTENGSQLVGWIVKLGLEM